MGLFKFLQKKEPVSKPLSEELPPIPPVRGPETPQKSPQLETSSLPPLPPISNFSDMPEPPMDYDFQEQVPEKTPEPSLPKIKKMPVPKISEPEIPSPYELEKLGEEEEIEEIPSKIPPLEIKSEGYTPKFVKESPKRGPIFIRSDNYKAMLDGIDQFKIKLEEEESIFLRLNDLKNSEDKLFETFRESIEDIQRKLLFVDKTLFEEVA